MDWSKSKSIFIVVFLILNIFLYTQYINVYKQGQEVEVLGEKTIESNLKEDNITYVTLPTDIEKVSYISGKVRNFEEDELPSSNIVNYDILDDHFVEGTVINPVKLNDSSDEKEFKEFVNLNVYEGAKYKFWRINEEEKYALFFQNVEDRALYYNSSGYLKVYWNDNQEIFKYEQTMLDKIEELEQEENAFPPIQVLQALYSKNLLKSDSRITGIKLGYSTLVQLTQTQVFAPTWEVTVRNADGETEEYFVNAVEGKVIELSVTSMETAAE